MAPSKPESELPAYGEIQDNIVLATPASWATWVRPASWDIQGANTLAALIIEEGPYEQTEIIQQRRGQPTPSGARREYWVLEHRGNNSRLVWRGRATITPKVFEAWKTRSVRKAEDVGPSLPRTQRLMTYADAEDTRYRSISDTPSPVAATSSSVAGQVGGQGTVAASGQVVDDSDLDAEYEDDSDLDAEYENDYEYTNW